jgi:hypothetical protein
MPEMDFIVSHLPDGTYHVQDKTGPHLGQHHVHSKEGFERWEKKRKLGGAISIGVAPNCDCGLAVGFVKEFNGKVWFNAVFGEKRIADASVEDQKPEEPISKPEEAAPEPVAPEAKNPKAGKKDKLPQVNEAKGEKMKFIATAQVEGKLETHEFEHEKASPWKVKDFAAKKFFAALIKDKKPLEIWKAIAVEPFREKIERKAKEKVAKVVKAKAKKAAKKNGKKAAPVKAAPMEAKTD